MQKSSYSLRVNEQTKELVIHLIDSEEERVPTQELVPDRINSCV